MEQIQRTFHDLRQSRKTGLIPFCVAGFPDQSMSKEIFIKLANCDLLEFGFPFSDPIADGPIIQQASAQAISTGITMDRAFDLLCEIRDITKTPIIFFSYFNPIHKYGRERFLARAKECQLDGVLVVDLPLEESRWLKPMVEKAQIAWIYLITPTTPDSRIKEMDRDGSGFLYYVSVTGVTGTRNKLPPDLIHNCERIRTLARLPLVVGFGISGPDHARALKPHVDGVVTGSAIISLIQNGGSIEDLGNWIEEMKTALGNGL